MTTTRNALDLSFLKSVDDHRFLVAHTLTTTVAVNLNRDFDGQPKRTIYGGVERMMVSSQCRVRAARDYSRGRIREDQQAVRTRVLPERVAAMLVSEHGYDAVTAAATAAAVVTSTGMGIDTAKPHQTTALMFVPRDADVRLVKVAVENREDLAEAVEAWTTAIDAAAANQAKGGKGKPKTVDAPAVLVPKSVANQAKSAFDPGTNVEIALYGRMVANISGGTVAGATQVAPSFTVDPMQEIVDNYTANDEWQSADVFGAANTGVQYLGSGTLYGFACLDRCQLRRNLAAGGASADEVEDAARDAERLFVDSMVWAVPSGKRTRTGSAVMPTVAVVAATSQPLTASAAFAEPIEGAAGVVGAERLGAYLATHQRVAPLDEGVVLWLSPDGSSAPEFPQSLTVEEG